MRNSKKTETIEVRLSLEQKSAFMSACAEENQTASEKIRTFISNLLHHRERRRIVANEAAMTIKKNPLKSIAAATAIMVFSIAIGIAPTAARNPVFSAWDENRDGVIAPSELKCRALPTKETGSGRSNYNSACLAIVAAMDFDNDGAINLNEFTALGRTTFKADTVLLVAGERVRRLKVDVIEWDASEPQNLQSGVSSSHAVVPLDANRDDVEAVYENLMRKAEKTAAGAS